MSAKEMENHRSSPELEPSPPDVRGGYLGYVAHEVRNPLSTALWSAELLTRMSAEDRGGARGEKLTAMCLRSLSRVRQLVEDHFLCERLDAHGIPVRLEPLGVKEVLDEVLSKRPMDGAPLAIDLPPALTATADRGLLERALDALIAVAGREGALVRVIGREQGGEVSLRIEGQAPGPDALDDPRKGSQGDPKGRSLSVPLARRAAEALGGSLSLEDGTYLLVLPAAEADRPGAALPAAHP